MTAQLIAAELGLKRSGKQWRGTCPICNDANPSFALGEAPDGKVLLHCFAGCDPNDIIAHVKSIDPQLWPEGTQLAKFEPQAAIRTIATSELLKRKPIPWLVKGAIPAVGVGTVIGPPGCGKTFITIDLVGCIIRGVPWFGHKISAAGAGILYITAEGVAGFANRVRAYQRVNPMTEFNLLRIIDQPINLIDPVQVQELIDCIRRDSHLYAPIKLVVLDTLNATMQGADENTSDGMGAYKLAMLRIASECKLFVLAIHHTGKDPSKGGRGHSSLYGAVDAEFTVAPEMEEVEEGRKTRLVPTGRKCIAGTKQRDGELMSAKFFELEPVPIGKDDDGDQITSCVVRPTGYNP